MQSQIFEGSCYQGFEGLRLQRERWAGLVPRWRVRPLTQDSGGKWALILHRHTAKGEE